MSRILQFELDSLKKTDEFGLRIGRSARLRDILTLSGDLGAGKTTLTQSIGKGLDVPASYYITSPTFNLLQEYPGRLPLYHMDLYRLSGMEEFEDSSLEEYIYGEGLTVIEWPDRLGDLMPADRLEIQLTIASETVRHARLISYGDYVLPALIRNFHLEYR